MNTLTEINGKKYIVSEDGTYYHENTANEVIDILERQRRRKNRIQLFFGDIETGRNCNEEYDTIGTIGRSTGTIKIPLLIKTSRSLGGGAISTDSIIGIKLGKTVLYKHPKFIECSYTIEDSDFEGYAKNTLIDGVLHGRHKTEISAKRTINKLKF